MRLSLNKDKLLVLTIDLLYILCHYKTKILLASTSNDMDPCTQINNIFHIPKSSH